MKKMLKWDAIHASMLMGPDSGKSNLETAARCAKSYSDQGLDLSIDLVEVEDRVFERRHDTGVKSFDELLRKNQGTFITGNVYGDAQVSQFVRSVNNIECNGFKFKPGELRAQDIKMFKGDLVSGFNPTENWLNNNPDVDCIVYAFRNKVRSPAENKNTMIYYGFLVTNDKHGLLYRSDNQNSTKSFAVMNEAELFLSTAHQQNSIPLVRIKDGILSLETPEMAEAYTEHVNQINSMEALRERP